MRLALISALSAAVCLAQLNGIVDTHVHSDPDSVPRSVDALEIARLAAREGIRALVLKNHNAATVQLAYIVGKVVPGIEVYGGVVLNRALGGINPAAIEHAALIKGGYLRIVWMPTFDAGNESAPSKGPFVPVSKGGKLLPEVIDVLRLISKHKLALATGHSTPAENLMLVREARKMGIAKIIVTHPFGRMSVAQMKEAAAEGAYIEFDYHSLLSPSGKGVTARVEAIKAIGPEHCVLSSDLGQQDSPIHTLGWKRYLELLRNAGISEAEIDRMARRNPALLVGLE